MTQPSVEVTVNLTSNRPTSPYVCSTEAPTPTSPSPKSHAYKVSSVIALVKRTVNGSHPTVSTAAKSTIGKGLTVIVTSSALVQPSAEVAVK